MRPISEDYKLASVFLNHSLKVKAKEKVLITVSDTDAFPLAKATYIEALKMGAYPVIDLAGPDLSYQFFSRANDWQLNYIPKEIMQAKVTWADAYVRIASWQNSKELNQIAPEKITLRSKLARPYLDKIVDSDRWILTYYPTASMAQEAEVAFDWLFDFYFKACLVDYEKMRRSLLKLERVLDQGSQVRLVGEKTNLSLSIKGRLAKACYGERNIPDGEVFLAPVADSVNGYVYFDFPSIAFGREVSGVYLEFKNGQVVKAKAEKEEATLRKVLETDKGAKYLGEFAIGANYNITQPMKNTLFDEKIGGTIHMALGRAYKEKRGGAPQGANESAIHWDIVKDMRKKGSFIEVDGKRIFENGKILV